MKTRIIVRLATCSILALTTACGTSLPESPTSEGRHLIPAAVEAGDTGIPSVVNQVPVVTVPQPEVTPETFSFVGFDVPVREVLFTIARESQFNIDIHPEVGGLVSLNAIDQTLPQLLERVASQINMRWSFDENNILLIEPDSPYWDTYKVDYVNVNRSAETEATVSTSIVDVTGEGQINDGNDSTAIVTQTSSNRFWTTLSENLTALLAAPEILQENMETALIMNPESGVITVKANSKQHKEVQSFLNYVGVRSLHQVLIEATVVEVSLSDNYQSGVDWSTLERNNGEISFQQSLNGINFIDPPTSLLTINDTGPDAINASIGMLSQFGDLKVLSSPKIMALNNQAAMLRVVDNKVYFTIDVVPGLPPTGVSPGTPAVFTSEVHTVPEGFVMSVTPQVSDNDQVTLHVRPTITRIVKFVNDPSPVLAEAGVTNAIPEMQVQEIESVLKVYSGQIAVLGGLMQDSLESNVDGIPTLSRLPGIRNLFSYRDETAAKTELIVFIRPVVIRQPSIDGGDLEQFRDYLPSEGIQFNSPPQLGFGRSGNTP